jgi:hypothetical protein
MSETNGNKKKLSVYIPEPTASNLEDLSGSLKKSTNNIVAEIVVEFLPEYVERKRTEIQGTLTDLLEKSRQLAPPLTFND